MPVAFVTSATATMDDRNDRPPRGVWRVAGVFLAGRYPDRRSSHP